MNPLPLNVFRYVSILIYSFYCAGYMGDDCSVTVDHCATAARSGNAPLCENGGQCMSTPSGFACRCLRGWTGDRCESEYDECERDPCQNGGECVRSTTGDRGYRCECLPGTQGGW